MQISTDEVYGSLGPEGKFTRDLADPAEFAVFREQGGRRSARARACITPTDRRSSITRCSNNYGPYQFPEKLIPLMIINALSDKPLPVYGDGLNVRDWIHVEDHCAAIVAALFNGKPGEVYNVGSDGEMRNIDVVKMILAHLGKPDSRSSNMCPTGSATTGVTRSIRPRRIAS